MKKLSQIILSSFFAIVLAMGLITTSAQATGVYDLPVVNSGEAVWVIDQADILSRSTESSLTNTLSDLAEKTGNEVRMIVIRRLDYGETMDTFLDSIFKSWFPTTQEQASQTLIAIDTLTNKTAIRSGEAVSELLTPQISTSLIKETIAIPLKDLQYNQALLDAGDRLVAVLSGYEDPGPPQLKEVSVEGNFATAEETEESNATTWVIVLLIVATIVPMVTYFLYVGFPGR